MALPVPPFSPNIPGALRYYDTQGFSGELAQIDLQLRGVSGEGDHLRETLSPHGNQVVRRYFCNWENRYAAALVLVGYAVQYTLAGALQISRLLPDQFSIIPGQTWACTSATLSPFAFEGTEDEIIAGQEVPTFRRCAIEATYEQLPYALAEDGTEIAATNGELCRYVIRPGYPGAEVTAESNYIALPGSSQQFTTTDGVTLPAGSSVTYGIGFSEHYSRRPYIWHRVPASCWGPNTPLFNLVYGDGTPDNRPSIGCINLVEFDQTYPPLSLLLTGVEEKLLSDPLGIGYAWDLKFNFLQKHAPYGHLGFYYCNVGAPAVGRASSAPVGPSGYYFAGGVKASFGKTTPYQANYAAIKDADVLFPLRDFNKLFVVNGR
jgi:hypothetical protein